MFVFCLRFSFVVFQSCDFSQWDGSVALLLCYELLISASEALMLIKASTADCPPCPLAPLQVPEGMLKGRNGAEQWCCTWVGGGLLASPGGFHFPVAPVFALASNDGHPFSDESISVTLSMQNRLCCVCI